MTPKKPNAPDATMRLNRYLARAGFGSRRGVEDLVTAGRVSIDGEVVRDLGRRVDPGRDSVSVDGQPTSLPRGVRIYAFHKPLDVVSTLRTQGSQRGLDEYQQSADLPERFKPVGRLDQDSTGLLLWTDDGDLADALLRPRSGVWKTYDVLLADPLVKGGEKKLADGSITFDGRKVRPCRVHLDPTSNRRRWRLELHEGRKRQIRRMVAAVNGKVIALGRVAVGPVELGRLRAGDFRRLTREEELALRDAVGRDAKR